MRYFALPNNYVTLGFSNKVRYTSFFGTFWRRMESTSQLFCVLVCQFSISFPTLEFCFSYSDIFFMTLGLTLLFFVVRCITYGNNAWNNLWKLRFIFGHHCNVFFITFVRFSYIFLMTLEFRYILVRWNYVRKLHYKIVIF